MDEFKNQPESPQHLEKVQMARTFEFWKYLYFLNDKYNCGLSLWSAKSFSQMSPRSGTLLSWNSPIMENIMENSSMLVSEKEKFDSLFDRMITAKLAFESFGGRYL